MPLVGLPLGAHRGDTMSSSEIAKYLASAGASSSDEYDLQLVPAYFPETAFSARDLPALYKLLSLMRGWSRVFGEKHMTQPAHEAASVNVPEVLECDFIWSSISDINEPFGFSGSRRDALAPFADHATRKDSSRP